MFDNALLFSIRSSYLFPRDFQLEEVSEREALLLQQAEQAEHVAIERQNLEAECIDVSRL